MPFPLLYISSNFTKNVLYSMFFCIVLYIFLMCGSVGVTPSRNFSKLFSVSQRFLHSQETSHPIFLFNLFF